MIKEETLEIIKVLKDKGYILGISWKDENKCVFNLDHLRTQKILYI